MGESESVGNHKEDQQSKNKGLSYIFTLIREIIAVFCWGYVITKLFFFDIDIFLAERLSPNYLWLLNYKFFFIIGTLAVIWLVTKNRYILLWSLFIFFYPLIIVFWRIPVLLLKKKSWNLTIALLDSIISFFKSFKRLFITTSFYLVSVAIIFGSSQKLLLWISIIVLSIMLLLAYIQRIIMVFKPAGIYQVYISLFNSYGKFIQNTPVNALDENELLLPIEEMNDKQLQKWVGDVQQLVLFNRMCLFVSRKMKSYQESGFNVVSSVLGVLLLVVFTVFSFAVINFGLYEIDQHFYSYTVAPSFFTFFYYSFNVLVFNQIQELTARMPMAQIALMDESFYFFFLVAILITLVLSFNTQKVANEMNEAIKNLSELGTRMEEHIKNKYKLDSIDIAIEVLQKLIDLKGSLVDLLNNYMKEE